MSSADGPSGRVERAILSTYDRTGVESFARALSGLGVELWATGGTRAAIAAAGTPVRAAEELTGIGSWFGGRVKTLHPAILGGLLAPPTPDGDRELRERGLLRFDLVAVNLYPFERHLAEQPQATDLEEYIDIGGVTLARAAAKNHAAVVAVTDPGQYEAVVAALRAGDRRIDAATRRALAARAFERCSAYDRTIAEALGGPPALSEPWPAAVELHREPLALRYGENPHQAAAVYAGAGPAGAGLTPDPLTLLKGEALSFTNLLDLDTAVSIVSEFPVPTAAIVKHSTPCGVASGGSVREAIERAIATDPVARYGCAIAVNRPFQAADAEPLHGVFVDLLAAPAVDGAARERLERRPKLKIVATAPPDRRRPRWEAKSALGRLLLQEADRRELAPGDLRLVTERPATPEQLSALDFAWRVVRHAKSNAIVLAQGSRTVGIGSGQPTRVKAVELAVEVAGDRARGAVLASDAFFPFADGIEAAGRAGVAAIVQPGGSLRDPEVIAAANRHGVAMYFTGWRVFRH